MITPIGSTMVSLDTGMTTAMNAGITGLTGYVGTPLMTSLAIYYLVQGIKISQGDGGPLEVFVTRLVRQVIVLWICMTAATYNQYVRDIFFTGLPTALNKAVMAQTMANAPVNAAGIANGITGTAAVFDQMSALIDQKVGMVLAQAPLLDVGSRVGALIFGFTGGLVLVVIAIVYELSRIVLAIVLILGVVCVGCLAFDVTKSIFERWIGKLISLVLMQVVSLVVLQVTVAADQHFMQQIVAAGGGVADQVQALVAMTVMMFMSAAAVLAISAVAYSIGGGVAVSALPVMYLAAKAMQAAASALTGMTFALPTAAAEAAESLSLGIARSELGGGSGGMLAAPSSASLPPPPLSLPSP